MNAIVLGIALVLGLPAAAGEVDDRLKAKAPLLTKILKENIIRFWYPQSIDRADGGYYMHFDAAGKRRDDGTKMIVTQARMVWFFARLARAGYGNEYLEAADHGYKFLKDKMWDHEHGGFYWEVDATGNRKLRPNKHLYGQAFGLYALAEFALASKRSDVLGFTTRFFHLLEEKSHDARHGGYNEFWTRDWKPASEQPYMGVPGGLKLFNTHLHILEALTTFYRASNLPLARERLLELINIESTAVVRAGLAACSDKFNPDWTPRLEGEWDRVSYGHDVENIWLLADACDAAGIPNSPMMDLHRAVFAYSRKYGFDEEKGGFYDTGKPLKPADRRQKVWWVQSEGLVGALKMYQLTREPQYAEVFEKTLDFIDKYQVDWKVGEWHSTVTPEGKGTGDKAQNWKAAYHNGRAMIECLEILSKL